MTGGITSAVAMTAMSTLVLLTAFPPLQLPLPTVPAARSQSE
jgi:hypothetical protein